MTKCTKIIILTVCLLVVGFSAVLILNKLEKIPVPPPLTYEDEMRFSENDKDKDVTVEYLGNEPVPVSTSSELTNVITVEQFYQLVTGNNTPYVSADTSDWKTYRNEEYGFEIKYPSTFSVSAQKSVIDGELGVVFENGSEVVHMAILQNDIVAKHFLDMRSEPRVRRVFINNIEMLYINSFAERGINIIFVKNNIRYSLYSFNKELDIYGSEVFNIINSFKFTN